MPHWQDESGVLEMKVQVHYGAQSIDTVSPTIDGEWWAELKDAAATGADAFNDAAAECFGGWYTNLTQACRTALRNAFTAM